MSKVRMEKLAGAIRKLKQRQATRQAQIARAMGGTGGRDRDSYLDVTQDEFFGIADILLSIGGPCVLLDAVENDADPTKRNPELAAQFEAQGFIKRDGMWACDDPQVEADFVAAWLAEADQMGREVSNREMIQRWAKVPAPGTSTTPAQPQEPEPRPEQTSGPGVSYDQVVAERARAQQGMTELDAWREAVRPGPPPVNDDLAEANNRRTTRQPRRRGR